MYRYILIILVTTNQSRLVRTTTVLIHTFNRTQFRVGTLKCTMAYITNETVRVPELRTTTHYQPFQPSQPQSPDCKTVRIFFFGRLWGLVSRPSLQRASVSMADPATESAWATSRGQTCSRRIQAADLELPICALSRRNLGAPLL